MPTHTDIVQRAAFRLGIKRAGQDLAGDLFVELKTALEDYLLELNEELPLDFDPTSATDVPDDRAPALINLFMYQPVFDQFDRRRGPGEREILALAGKKRLFAAITGETDYVEPVARDY